MSSPIGKTLVQGWRAATSQATISVSFSTWQNLLPGVDLKALSRLLCRAAIRMDRRDFNKTVARDILGRNRLTVATLTRHPDCRGLPIQIDALQLLAVRDQSNWPLTLDEILQSIAHGPKRQPMLA
ncbi:hypothetical protein ABIB90_007713 [Bradyrhizobium sp. JR4.1]|uniref:hypothetical protein n=1 Tax=Bradyrhizobium sp. JR4.1 TaxID=3156372 RepID=UPI003394AA4D